MKRLAFVSAALFVATVFAANWLVHTYGPVPVGFGLTAPAGVYVVGVAFLLRDTTQRLGGRLLVFAAILVGTGCAALVDPTLAKASACAFAASEIADFGVYSVLERLSFAAAVVTSNIVGALVDSLIFLSIAFGSLAFFWGQVVGKLWITVAVVPILLLLRQRIPEPA